MVIDNLLNGTLVTNEKKQTKLIKINKKNRIIEEVRTDTDSRVTLALRKK